MKEHISVTIEKRIVDLLKKYAKAERRSVSQVSEIAIETYLDKFNRGNQQIVTSDAAFKGQFSRADTYEKD